MRRTKNKPIHVPFYHLAVISGYYVLFFVPKFSSHLFTLTLQILAPALVSFLCLLYIRLFLGQSFGELNFNFGTKKEDCKIVSISYSKLFYKGLI